MGSEMCIRDRDSSDAKSETTSSKATELPNDAGKKEETEKDDKTPQAGAETA